MAVSGRQQSHRLNYRTVDLLPVERCFYGEASKIICYHYEEALNEQLFAY